MRKRGELLLTFSPFSLLRPALVHKAGEWESEKDGVMSCPWCRPYPPIQENRRMTMVSDRCPWCWPSLPIQENRRMTMDSDRCPWCWPSLPIQENRRMTMVCDRCPWCWPSLPILANRKMTMVSDQAALCSEWTEELCCKHSYKDMQRSNLSGLEDSLGPGDSLRDEMGHILEAFKAYELCLLLRVSFTSSLYGESLIIFQYVKTKFKYFFVKDETSTNTLSPVTCPLSYCITARWLHVSLSRPEYWRPKVLFSLYPSHVAIRK